MRAPNQPADPYALLMVPRDCTANEARRAFREAAMRVHPDVCDAPDAAEQFIRVKAAFDAVMRRLDRLSVPDSTGVSPAAARPPPDPNDIDDMAAFVRAMEEAWTAQRNEARRRWQASEAWKEREYEKHKRSKVKRRAARAGTLSGRDGAEVAAVAPCVRTARKANWRGGGRIRP
ncbi:hypothetical protein KFE25_013619 [Diacronema lutheri]|uniref:J domain-containing protein n=1 Tax=Diacronema lutheri TaxID=2081491 RepID=A0A8J5XGP7_DIALT|nr:hypothetical protein KFE25_013619 [Diacronema lutheri]